MYSGKLIKIIFEFNEDSLEAVLDSLPMTKVIKQYEDKYLIEVEVFRKGVIMWILDQGSKIRIISPVDFINDVACDAKR